MSLSTETKMPETSAVNSTGLNANQNSSESMLLPFALLIAAAASKRQLRKLKTKLVLTAIRNSITKLFSFKKASSGKDPAFALLLVGGLIVGLMVLLNVSTVIAVCVALFIVACMGAAAYA
ncbi:MAG TPA: hypothetical protein VF622_05060 [Segetibacter sp.]|jgi:hypothetical protein